MNFLAEKLVLGACIGTFLAGPAASFAQIQAYSRAVPYGGRLMEADGRAISGNVDLKLRFYRSASVTSEIPTIDLPVFQDVIVENGNFQVQIELPAAGMHALFNGEEVWVEMTDQTSGRSYPRQEFMLSPYALKVPADGHKITYNSDGELILGSGVASGNALVSLVNSNPTAVEAAKIANFAGDLSGSANDLRVVRLKNQELQVNTAQVNDHLKWDGSKWIAAPVASATGGTVTSIQVGEGLSGATLTADGTVGLGLDGLTVKSAFDQADLVLTFESGGDSYHKMTGTDFLAGIAMTSHKGAASGYAALNSSSKVLQDPANAQVSAAAGRIPLAGGSGTLAEGWIPQLSGPGQVSADSIQAGTIGGSAAFSVDADFTLRGKGGGSGVNELKFQDQLNAKSSVFKAPLSFAADLALTLPGTHGSNGEVLTTDDDGVLSWKMPTSVTMSSVNGKTGPLNLNPSDVSAQAISGKAQADGYPGLDAGSLVQQDPANSGGTPGAGKIPLGSGSSTLALGWLPATLTGKDADSIDGIDGSMLVQTSRILTGGTGLSGGGGLSANRSLSLGIPSLTDLATLDLADTIAIHDSSTSAHREMTAGDFLAGREFHSNKGAAGGYASLNGSSKVIQNPASAQTGAAPGKIPVSGGGGSLDKDWFATASGDSGAGGTKGLVPAPASGDSAQGKYLKADLTWSSAFQNTFTHSDSLYIATDEIRARDSDGLKLNDLNGAPVIRVENGGEVGLGTDVPAQSLHFKASDAKVLLENTSTVQYSSGGLTFRTLSSADVTNFYLKNSKDSAGAATGNSTFTFTRSNATGWHNQLFFYENSTNLIMQNNAGGTFSNGNVGIGDPSPQAKLSVTGTTQFKFNTSHGYPASAAASKPSAMTSRLLNGQSTTGTLGFIEFSPTNAAGDENSAYIGALSTGTYNPIMVFGRRTGASSYAEVMRINADGLVGIGTSDPVAGLHVVDSTGHDINTSAANSGSLIIQAQTGGRTTTVGPQLEFSIPASIDGSNPYAQGRIIAVADNTNDNDATGRMYIGAKRQINKIGAGTLWYFGEDITIDGTGKVGIKNVSPAKTLDVTGTGKISGSLTAGSGNFSGIVESQSTRPIRFKYGPSAANTTNAPLRLKLRQTKTLTHGVNDGHVLIQFSARSDSGPALSETWLFTWLAQYNATWEYSAERIGGSNLVTPYLISANSGNSNDGVFQVEWQIGPDSSYDDGIEVTVFELGSGMLTHGGRNATFDVIDATQASAPLSTIASGYTGKASFSGSVSIGVDTTAYALDVNGQPAANGYTAFTNYSDRRLKSNIRLLPDGSLEKILNLKPSTFYYNDLTHYDTATRERKITGLIAQELAEQFPEMIAPSLTSGNEYLSTNLSALPVHLVKALQEEDALVQEQNKELQSLLREMKIRQGKLNDFEKRLQKRGR